MRNTKEASLATIETPITLARRLHPFRICRYVTLRIETQSSAGQLTLQDIAAISSGTLKHEHPEEASAGIATEASRTAADTDALPMCAARQAVKIHSRVV